MSFVRTYLVRTDVIYRVDPQTNSVVSMISPQLLASEGSIGIAAGSLWLSQTKKVASRWWFIADPDRVGELPV